MCFYIATIKLRRRRYVVVLESVSTYFVVCGFDRTIRAASALMLFMRILVVCE